MPKSGETFFGFKSARLKDLKHEIEVLRAKVAASQRILAEKQRELADLRAAVEWRKAKALQIPPATNHLRRDRFTFRGPHRGIGWK